MPKHFQPSEKTTEIMMKIGIIAGKNQKFFVEFSDEIMDVDSFACFDVIFLEKKRAMRLPSLKKVIYYVTLI